MILATTSDIIRVITDSNATLDVVADYADLTTVSFVAGRQLTKISTATTTTVLGSPGSSTQRQLKNFNLTNTHASLSVTITLQFYDGTNAYKLIARALAPGEGIEFNKENGWTFPPINTVPQFYEYNATDDPAVPAAGKLLVYAKTIAGRNFLKSIGPSGLSTPLQHAFWQNNITMWSPTTATTGLWLGTAGAGAGTFNIGLPSVGNNYTLMKRSLWSNVATTLNQVLGQRNTEVMYLFQNGFFFFTRMGFTVWTNGGRFFAGLATGTTVVSGDPSTVNNIVGFAVDAADNGLIYFQTKNTGAASRTSTGLTISNNKGYDCYIFYPPGGSTVYWRIKDFVGDVDVSGSTSAELPNATTAETVQVLASNAALTPVTSIQIGINRIYVETDY